MDDARPAGLLGAVHGAVRQVDQGPRPAQRVDQTGPGRRGRHPDRRRDRRRTASRDHPSIGGLGQSCGGVRAGQTGEHHELLAAHPGDHGGGRGQPGQLGGDGDQDLVPCGMSVSVVGLLEVVQVDCHGADRLTGLCAVRDESRHLVLQLPAVGQPGERVLVGQRPEEVQRGVGATAGPVDGEGEQIGQRAMHEGRLCQLRPAQRGCQAERDGRHDEDHGDRDPASAQEQPGGDRRDAHEDRVRPGPRVGEGPAQHRPDDGAGDHQRGVQALGPAGCQQQHDPEQEEHPDHQAHDHRPAAGDEQVLDGGRHDQGRRASGQSDQAEHPGTEDQVGEAVCGHDQHTTSGALGREHRSVCRDTPDVGVPVLSSVSAASARRLNEAWTRARETTRRCLGEPRSGPSRRRTVRRRADLHMTPPPRVP